MPRVKTLTSRKAPIGWEQVEPTLKELTNQIKDVENEPFDGRRKPETAWKIFKLHHQRSRFIYETFYFKKEISRELYEYCLQERWGDANLIAKWKKQGYERLCCLNCIQNSVHHFGSACICRVPRTKLEEGKLIQCTHCGCRGCASGD